MIVEDIISELNGPNIERIKGEIEKIDEIYGFMKKIGVPRDVLPFSYRNFSGKMSNTHSKEIKEIDEFIRIKEEKALMEYYLSMWRDRCKNKEELILCREEILARYSIFDSWFETIVDVLILNKDANNSYKESPQQITKIFTVDNMKAVGHPENDKIFEGETPDLIMRICRMDWEYKYLSDLSDELNELKQKGERREYKKICKDIKSLLIMDWNANCERMQYSKQNDDETFVKIYEMYMKNLPKEKIDEANDYLKKLKKAGWLK